MALPTCPKKPVLADLDEVLRGCDDDYYGVALAEIGEEGDAVIAFGHHEPRRYLAAMLKFARVRGWGARELNLGVLPAGDAEKAKQWRVIYRHADAETVGNHWSTPDWCVCDDCNWWAVEAAEDAPGATPVMWWEI